VRFSSGSYLPCMCTALPTIRSFGFLIRIPVYIYIYIYICVLYNVFCSEKFSMTAAGVRYRPTFPWCPPRRIAFTIILAVPLCLDCSHRFVGPSAVSLHCLYTHLGVSRIRRTAQLDNGEQSELGKKKTVQSTRRFLFSRRTPQSAWCFIWCRRLGGRMTYIMHTCPRKVYGFTMCAYIYIYIYMQITCLSEIGAATSCVFVLLPLDRNTRSHVGVVTVYMRRACNMLVRFTEGHLVCGFQKDHP
jgi:hypothetical protein